MITIRSLPSDPPRLGGRAFPGHPRSHQRSAHGGDNPGVAIFFLRPPKQLTAPRGTSVQLGLTGTKPRHEPGPRMTLGNMRGLGVHNLIAYCQKHILAVSEVKPHAG
jgi:hypothetical protein